MLEYARKLSELAEASKVLFVKYDPEIPDFTSRSNFKITILGPKERLEIEATPENIIQLVSLFDVTIFDRNFIQRLIVWNIKPFCTYFHNFCSKFVQAGDNVVDLKVIELFLGIIKKCPENFKEALDRVKFIAQFKNWHKIYKLIHQPLSYKVLPSIETTPLLSTASRRCVYPCYEIEGQINGRMNCAKKYAYSYLPHNMGPDVRSDLRPRGDFARLCTSDYRHCEVNVLQFISGDDVLKSIIDSGGDVHSKIYECITGDSCETDNKRVISKKMFLPVMYGCGPKGLASNLKISESSGEELCKRIYRKFPVATAFMEKVQAEASVGTVFDYFGRPRKFKSNQGYLFRNTCIQSVAATVCLEKLIALWNQTQEIATIAFSVHDCYGLVFKSHDAKKLYDILKSVLESESELCVGLKMNILVKFGIKLSDMKVFWK